MVMGHIIMTKNSSSTGCPLKTASSTPAAGTSMGLHPITCTHRAIRTLSSSLRVHTEVLLIIFPDQHSATPCRL